MADIQFNITLDLVEKYVPAENVTVVQESLDAVKFIYTILNSEQPVDLTGATDIVVSFVKPDGHIVLQNDGSLVNGKIELVANPQAFTYVGKTYFQVQYKIGTSIYNTRQAFLWVEKGHTSCQTVSSTDFAPMLDQAIQAGQMLAGIDLQALIDSKVTAENAQADVDALELRVGALEVTIVGLDSRVDALEAGQASQDTRLASLEGNITTVISEVDALQLTAVDHETRIDGLEASMPNLSPIEADITDLKAKDVQQDGRIGANELVISSIQTKNTQQDTAIAGNATEIGKLQAEQTTQNNRLTTVENKNASQDSAIGDIQAKNTQQDAAISALQSSQATQDTDIAAIKTKNTQQDTAISANATSITTVDGKVTANKTAQDTINTSTAGSIANHTSRIEDLEADSTTDNARITNLEMDNSNNKTRISAVEGAVGVLNSDINDLQGSDAIQTADIVAIKTKNSQQDVAISDNTAAITTNKTDTDSKITGLTTRVGTAETDITGLKAKDVTHETRMSAIENKNNDQDTRMTTIEGVNTTQNTRLGTLETDNTSNKNRLTTLETDNTSNKNRLTAVEGKNTSQDTAIAGKVNTADIYTAFVQPSGRSNILATGTDLDTVEAPGQYAGNSLLNAPYPTGVFYIEVQQHTVAGYAKQQATYLNSTTNEQFTRRKRDTNGWTPWVKIANEPDVVKKTEIYSSLVKPDGGCISISNTDLDNLKTPGFYSGFTLGNAPAGITGTLYVDVSLHTAAYIKQEATTTTNTSIQKYMRELINNVWTPWIDITGRAKDGRATLVATPDATITSGSTPVATRRGNTITVNIDLTRNIGSTNAIVTNLPADMLPIDSYTFDAIATDGTPSRVLIRFNGEIHLDVIGKRYRLLATFVTN